MGICVSFSLMDSIGLDNSSEGGHALCCLPAFVKLLWLLYQWYFAEQTACKIPCRALLSDILLADLFSIMKLRVSLV